MTHRCIWNIVPCNATESGDGVVATILIILRTIFAVLALGKEVNKDALSFNNPIISEIRWDWVKSRANLKISKNYQNI